MRNPFSLLLEFLFPGSRIDKVVREIEVGEFIERAKSSEASLSSLSLDLSWARALFDYKDPLVRHALWQLKYKGNKKLARLFSEIIYSTLIEELGDLEILDDFKKPILIFIPLHKKRLRERGFNQMELVAKDLVLIDAGNSFEYGLGFLEKIRETKNQTSLKKEERVKNLKGAFGVKEGAEIVDRNIILLDDVITTGATVLEARETLIKAGARSVFAMAIAH